MKKIIAFFLFAILLLSSSAFADWDFQSMTEEELREVRLAINIELAERNNSPQEIVDGTSVKDLFPDEWISNLVRNELGKFSVEDVITQDELNKIRRIFIDGQTTEHIQIVTLEGIQYLQNLEELYINKQDNISEIPEWVGSLANLKSLTFRYCPVQIVPDCVCDLINLRELNLYGSDVTALPEDIGNLVNLRTLDIRSTQITSLPESIYALNLEKFNRDGLDTIE